MRTLRRDFRERCSVTNVLVTYSLPIVFCWSICLYLGVTLGTGFLSETKWTKEGPQGSPSVKAEDIVVPFFPQKLSEYEFSQAVLVVARDPDVASVQSAAVADLTATILNNTLGACERDQLPITRDGACWWRGASGLFAGVPADLLPADFVSADGKSATLIFLCAKDPRWRRRGGAG